MLINSVNKSKLKKWVTNLDKKSTKNVLLVYGKSGLGKYTTVYNTLNELEYDVHTFHSIDFLNKKNIKMLITKMVNNKSIYMMMNKKKCKNAIIIKELEALNKPHNLKFITEIINTNFVNNNNSIPLVCIASGNFFKKLSDLEKISEKIKFKKPSNVEFKKHIRNIFKEKNMSVETKLTTYITKSIDSNFRQFNNVLDYMVNNKATKYKLVDYKDIVDIISINESKEIELYEMIVTILNSNNMSLNKMIDFFNVEKIFLPLMIHQNLKLKLFYNNNNKLDDYLKVMNIVSKSDIIHKYIFDFHYWNLQEAYSILSCYYPYYIVKDFKKRVKMEDLKFTSILNKNSLKYATHLNCNKIMRNSKKLLYFDDILLIYYCRYLARYLLSDNIIEQEKGLELLINNNYKISDISKIIKFTNFEQYEKKYSKKVYNKLKKIHKQKYLS